MWPSKLIIDSRVVFGTIKLIPFVLISFIPEIITSSPLSVTNKEFSLNLREATKSKVLIRIPSLFLKPILGEATQVLTNSQNVKPTVLQSIGFQFKYTKLIEALNSEFENENITIEKYKPKPSEIDQEKEKYNIQKRGQYQLNSEVLLNRDSESIFTFF